MKRVILSAAILWGAALAAHAEPCKAFYPLGEPTPAGCVKSATQWGTGQPVAPSPHPDTGDVYERTFFKSAPPVSLPRVGR